MNIWKSLLAVCLLTAMFGCGASASKKANQEGAAKQLPRLCVTVEVGFKVVRIFIEFIHSASGEGDY